MSGWVDPITLRRQNCNELAKSMFRIRKVEAILTGAGCKSLLQPALYAPRPVPSNEGLCIEPPRTRTGDPQLRRRSEAFSQRRSCSSTLGYVHAVK